MGFVRHEQRDTDRPITGGLVTYETMFGKLTFVYRMPRPGELRDVDPVTVALTNKLRRMQVEILRYLDSDKPGSKGSPQLAFDEHEVRPIIDAVARCIIEIRGLDDAMTGVSISLEELAEKELDEILWSLGTKFTEHVGNLLNFYRHISESNGLKGDQRERLVEWLQIEYLDGGCNCLKCAGHEDFDANCRFNHLRPLDDVVWLLEQYAVHQNSDTGAMPRWLLQVFGEIRIAQTRRRELEKEAAEQQQLIDEHLRGKR